MHKIGQQYITTSITLVLGFCMANVSLAQFTVFDPSVFGQAVVTASNSAETVLNQTKQIAHQIRMVELQMRALERVTDSEYWHIGRRGLQDQIAKIRRVIEGTEDVNRRIKRIHETIGELTEPVLVDGNQTAQSATPEITVENLIAWEQDLAAATEATVESQVTVDEVRDSTAATMRILGESQKGGGQVRQLQSTNALLAQVSQHLGALSLATGAAARQAAAETAVETGTRAAERQASEAFFADPNLDTADGQVFRGGRPQ